MRVERIELVGFKSFADRTTFKFHPGITSIVGPNGCGKSNIVDAFKWVLGEQSAKCLRGDSMEDVIFSGSATKKTKGMAEVTLVLSDIVRKSQNGDEPDSPEKDLSTKISVTRRLYRSGESEYLMNKVPCRLKDIRNMFLDTGLELKAYSILEQGTIGDIVNSKPVERRFLIEEVAGVMKYKIRKNEAISKLESSKVNLQRIQDVIAEVKRQINTIDRHAKKAERYKKLFEQVKNIELKIGKRDFMKLTAEISSLNELEESIKSREAEMSAQVHSLDAIIEEKNRLCVENEKALNEIRDRLYALDKEATEEEGQINLLKRDCENLRERLAALRNLDDELDKQEEDSRTKLRNVERSHSEMIHEISELEGILAERTKVLSGLESEIKSAEERLEQTRRLLFSKAEDISTTKNAINHLQMNLESLERKTERSQLDMSSINNNMNSLHQLIDETSTELDRIREELQKTVESKDNASKSLSRKKSDLRQIEEKLYADREDLAALISKLDSLEEIDKSQKCSLDESVRAVCQLAEAFETKREYETAIEAILGDRLRAEVVEAEEDITNAVNLVKKEQQKRSGFVTKSPFPGAVSFSFSDAIEAGKDGIIGYASDYITPKEGFSDLVNSILDGVIIVITLDSAFTARNKLISEKSKDIPYFVSLDGDVIEPSGIVFSGVDKGVLKIKRMIKELKDNIAIKKNVIGNSEKIIESLRNEIVSIENELVSLDGKISSHDKYMHELSVKMENLKEEDKRLSKKHEYIAIEIKDDSREKENLQTALNEKTDVLNKQEHEKSLIETEITDIRNDISSRNETRETMRSELTEIRLNLASSTEKMASIKNEIDRLSSALKEIAERKINNKVEQEQIETDIKIREEEIVTRDTGLKSKIILIGELQNQASRESEHLDAMTAELSLIEKQQKELSAKLEAVRTELNNSEMAKMEKTMKLNYLREDIYKTYSVEIGTADISEELTDEEEKSLPEMKDKLQSIGPVSLGALEEYEELKERYEFLNKQKDDLTESIEAMENTIRKINRTTQKRLTEAFEALNVKFKEVFTMLFGRGRAELQLTEGNILDAGIEIIAQPPGKKLQNLTLLSGGEKALTALSLLFAGFMIKPTPLCILDEVDAPLDESNTERFIHLLTELAKDIQFITITHNRRTMEAANYLYGITMEEPGSSKVVSMHLAEAV